MDWIGPVYQLINKEKIHLDESSLMFCPLPNVVIIKTIGNNDEQQKTLAEITDKYSLREINEKSKYLKPYRYFVITKPDKLNAYLIRDALSQYGQTISEVLFENMPMIVPTAISPNDPLFSQQWDMTKIQAGGSGSNWLGYYYRHELSCSMHAGRRM